MGVVLTAYLLRSRVRGLALTDRGEAIDPERGADSVALRTDLPFEARLFVPPSSTGPPDSQGFLEQGSAGPLGLLEGATNGAALLVRVPLTEGDRWVAFTFGTGRFLLRRQWLERRFGLRAALNLAYPRGEVFTGPVPPRLKTIDARTIDEVTYDTRRRASRSVPLEHFGLNVRRDLVGAVEAYPADRQDWGKVVQGGMSFRHSKGLRFNEIGTRARRLVEVWAADDFPERFSFIDHIKPVDHERIDTLEGLVVQLLAAEDHGGFDLLPPEDLGSEAVAGFKLPHERGTHYDPELTLEDYLHHVGDAPLDAGPLQNDMIRAVDGRGKPLGRASAFDFLTGQVNLDGATYVLIEGVFFEVNPNFLEGLAADIDVLPRYTSPLPPWRVGQSEPKHNQEAATSPDLLLLDTLTVRPAGRSSDIEVCDLLSRNGAFLHVKKKRRSSTLSHLFSQGHVSAELLIREAGFRGRLIELVDSVEHNRIQQEPTFQAGFKDLFDIAAASPGQHEIVFVIIGD